LTAPELVMVLTENWTLIDSRRLRDVVWAAKVAEDAGFGTVMLSEHVVLGPSADAVGVMENPRDYAALGIPFRERGARLDDHLDAWRVLWRDTPASFTGRHVTFEEVSLEPKPYRREGPTVWIGGSIGLPAVGRRLADHGHGYHPLGQPDATELEGLWERVRARGGEPQRLELIGGVRPRFPDARSVADVDEALESVPQQVEAGYSSICIKPSQYLDDLPGLPVWCRHVRRRVEELGG
jgi:alkanesulfonate monooxygenase SsuD/methylene tetrahydromethanopterin reductase-like flavin-dependent oxidoreductase (luciferase family)